MHRTKERRKQIIYQIVETLNQAEVMGRKIDDKKLIYELCVEAYCSIRTAKEYLKIAQTLWESQQK